MPAKGIRGGKLAQEILRLSEQLEGDFRREFFDEIATYANNSAIKKLLNDIDSGKFTATSSVSVALEKVVFASDRLDAIARKAMGKSARISAKTTTGFELKFNVINPEVVATARTMSINLSTTLNKATRETLRKIIQDAVEGNLTTLQAARKIRNHVGLIPAHSDAVDRYYDTLIQSGMKSKLAQKQADAYAQRLLKYRGETIARTEIARAVGEGQTAMWKQMVQEGYLPVDAKRVWITALDERTCKICEPMNGVETDIYGSWNTPNGFVQYPQDTHPNCRCTQGVVMPKASRSKIGKASEFELNQWLLSKENPHHDEIGRFTFSPAGKKVGATTRSTIASTRRKHIASIKRIADQSQITESGEYKPSQEIIQAFESYTFGGGDYYVVQHQANLKPQTSSKKLHRGMTFEKEEFDKFVGEIKVGKQFQIQSSSWSELLSVAKEFASQDAPSGSIGDYSVIMSVSAGAKGVHIEPYAYVDWKYQKEWYLGDAKYKVTGISVRGKRATISLDYTK